MGDLEASIKVDLTKVQAALRQADTAIPQMIKTVFNAAVEDVAADTRRMIPSGPSGAARASVRVVEGESGGKVTYGGQKAPYLPWLDFGGPTGIKGSVKRRYIKGGRYLFPAYSDNRKRILEEMTQGATKALRDSGLDVT